MRQVVGGQIPPSVENAEDLNRVLVHSVNNLNAALHGNGAKAVTKSATVHPAHRHGLQAGANGLDPVDIATGDHRAISLFDVGVQIEQVGAGERIVPEPIRHSWQLSSVRSDGLANRRKPARA